MVKMTENHEKYLVVTSSPDKDCTAKWNNCLRNAAFASHYVSPDFFVDPFAGSGERFAVLATDGDRINAVLTGVKVNDRVMSGLGVRPQTVFRNGANRVDSGKSLAYGLAAVAGQSADLVQFYSWEPIDGLDGLGYEHEQCFGADQVVMLDLTKGAEALFKEFSERRRTDLRKTMKQGKLHIKILETEAELAELYEIHKDWNRRKGNAPDPFDSFQAAVKSEHRAIFIAVFEGKIVAGTYLRFCSGGVVEYAANNSLGEFQKLRPNELLGWKAIEWACESGFKKFSLGASHPFLARYGGELVAAHRYQLDNTLLKLHANRERLSRFAVKTYQSLPESVRRRIKSVAAKV